MKYITKEVRIGIAGIVALCVLIYGINWLKGIHMFQPSSYFYAKFENVNGLTKSSPVFADGVRVGIVRDIYYDYAKPGNVIVEVELDTELRIPKGSSAELVSELMGGVRMNILLANNPREKYAVGDTIPGTLNNGMMESAAKLIPKVEEMLPKLDSILISLNNIKWETTTQTNVGIDFSLFKQSLYGSLEYYYKKTTDILTEMAGVGVLGEGGNRWINSGAMKNQGFEFNLGYRNKTAFGLTYDLNGNISTYRNEILELPETVAANGKFGGNGVKSVVGHTYNSQVGYIADGIFKSQEEVDNHATQEGAAVGRIRYRDIDHNGVIDEKDQEWIYDPTPAFSYGLNIYLEYKNFDLTMFWQGVQGVDIISDVKKKSDFWSASNVGFLNKGTRLLNAWSPTNPNSTIPALTRSDTNNEQRVSTYFVENGSFLKLRNIQLGYTVPAVISKKLRMERLRFYCSAQNLLTIKSKDFTGEDPENPNFSYPIPVNITFGLNIGF